MPLSEGLFKVTELGFGAHFHTEIILNKSLGERFYREVTRARSRLFTTSLIQEGVPFLYHNERTKTQCIINAGNWVFTEREVLNSPEQFLKDCTTLMNKFIEIFEYPPNRFRLFGKIYRYRLTHPGLFLAFKNATATFSRDDIFQLQIRMRLVEDEKNIHIQIASASDAKQEPDTLTVDCDVNNANQHLDHDQKELEQILGFADEYNPGRLASFLGERLPI